MNRTRMIPLSVALIATFVATGITTNAQDWPQWRGANREGISTERNLNLDWTEQNPPLLWTFRDAGSGFSAPTIVGTTLYCQGAAEGNDFAFALDTKSGNLIWKQNLGALSVSFQNRGDGPRGSVTVDGNRLYLIRGAGQIHCLSADDGKMIWERDLVKDFDGKMMSDWGYSESPLIDGNLVLCSPGGNQGAVVALDKSSGAVVWQCNEVTDQAGYSSPIVAEVDGVRQYIQLTGKGIVGIDAKGGKLLWYVEVPAFRTAVIPTPIYFDNMVYVTNGYNVGCLLIKLTKTGDLFDAKTIYANKNMSNHHGGAVLINGYVYGYSETAGWACQDVKTGENMWTKRDREVGKGSLFAFQDRLILLDMATGLLTVVAASPDGWMEFGRMPIPERTTIQTNDNHMWTHPIVAHGKLYVRDHDLLFCFDLSR